VDRYFGSGEEDADYSGQPTPNIETDGWGMVLWAARAYVEASGDTGWLGSTTKAGDTVYDALVGGIAQPMEANLESSGIMKADSGVWEVHDANKKHFAFTTMAAARGFCDLAALASKAGHGADATKYRALAATVKAAFLSTFVDAKGALGGSLEGISNNTSRDGSTAAAFTWNILDDFTGPTANATLGAIAQLEVLSGGFKRNDDNLSSADDDERILVDLLVSNALRRNGRAQQADGYLDLVVSQAAANYYLIPELYNSVGTDGPIGKYTGSTPMVGYGAGLYLMTMLDRSGLIDPNDCGDDNGVKLPVVTCSDGSTSSSGAGGSTSTGGDAAGGGAGGGGAGGSGTTQPGSADSSCACRAGAPAERGAAAMILLAAIPCLLPLRRARRRHKDRSAGSG
jgi:GH15 family glucan-1,4-alpha-glucosidase